MFSNPNELTWRQMRRQQPILIRLFSGIQLRICVNRLKLPCARLDAMERATQRRVINSWANRQDVRRIHKGMMVDPMREREY